MPRLKHPRDELAELARHSTHTFVRALNRVVRAQFNEADRELALANLQTVFAQTMTLADLLGRRRLLLESDVSEHVKGLPDFLFRETAVFPHVQFEEAIRNLTSREPRLAKRDNGTPLWKQVAELYQERHSFALAQSADLQLTQRVQRLIVNFAQRGATLSDAETAISEIGGWTKAYAETVYRTNLSTAYTAGRFSQAQDPDVARVIGAFQYTAAKDSDVRRGRPQDNGENHLAADGLIASTTDPIWDSAAPPSGHNCRCTVRMVPRSELKARGLVDGSGAVRRLLPASFASYRRGKGFGASRARAIYA